jgi:acyl carrier protein
LNTVLQGAWALLLSHYSGMQDVVFGVTVSGRSAPLPGIEDMVGVFINTLPARARVEPESSLAPWLRRIQELQFETRQYEFSPLVEVSGWSDAPRGRPLFESILVFENIPVNGTGASLGGMAIRDGHYHERTHYPLTVVIVPGRELILRIVYDCRRLAHAAVERLLGDLVVLIEAMIAAPMTRLAELPFARMAERQGPDCPAAPTPEDARSEAVYVAPRTVVEQALAEIWAQSLGIERVGIEDNFFELGGHSLLAARVVARVRAALGVEMPVDSLFQAPTVARFAELMIEREVETAPAESLRQTQAAMESPPAGQAQDAASASISKEAVHD